MAAVTFKTITSNNLPGRLESGRSSKALLGGQLWYAGRCHIFELLQKSAVIRRQYMISLAELVVY